MPLGDLQLEGAEFMPHEHHVPFQVVKPHGSQETSAVELHPFEQSVIREFAGLNAMGAHAADANLSSPVQLDALLAGLKPGEAMVARLDLAASRSSGLSIEVLARGASKRDAAARSGMLGDLLDAALASSLPFVDIRPRRPYKTRAQRLQWHTLVPAGPTLPLGAALGRPRGREQGTAVPTPHDWSEIQRDVIVFSARACGPHLAGLALAITAITPLVIEVHMTREKLGPKVLKQIDDARARINDRVLTDAAKLQRDSRYADADRRLEELIVAGSGVKLHVLVGSKRALHDSELSALSAAMFGTPHAEGQRGHLASLRSLYPRECAVQSFLGIIAAAVIPVMERQQIRRLDTLDGNVIGKTASDQLIRMAVNHPRSHTYVIGRPGSGKSTLLLNLILQDIEGGDAVILVDPHGDLWADVRDRLPARRMRDVELVHMGDPLLQPRLNLLELGPGDAAEARARVVDTLYQLVRRLMFSGLTVDATGPMFNKYFRAGLMLLLEGEGAKAQIQTLERIFTDSTYRDQLIARPSVSPETRQQWKQILGVDGSDHKIENMTPWVTSKLTQITQSAILRPILGAMTTSLDFDRVLAENKVCLINLANGRIGTEAAGLLGGILTHRLEQSAKRQENVELDKRNQASVYFDEFHTFASEFLRPLMAESRKFGLRVTLANQTLSQMVNNDIDGGVFREVLGNCANSIVFAVDVEDARYLAPRFGGKIDAGALVAQSNYRAVCLFQTAAGALGPFSVRTLPAPKPRRK
jgi:hypothetical protein